MKYTIITMLSIDEAVKKIGDLLLSESVKFNILEERIVSTHIPLPLMGFDKRLYSRKNWIGINPFIFLSGIGFIFIPQKNGGLIVEVEERYARSVFLFLAIIAIAAIIAMAIPQMWVKVAFFSICTVVSAFWIFVLCIKLLPKSEIKKVIAGVEKHK